MAGYLEFTEAAAAGTLASTAIQRDAAGRETGADHSQPQGVSPANGVATQTYDAASQLTGATYDGLGRVKKDALRSYSFDAASRLLSYQGSDGTAWPRPITVTARSSPIRMTRPVIC